MVTSPKSEKPGSVPASKEPTASVEPSATPVVDPAAEVPADGVKTEIAVIEPASSPAVKEPVASDESSASAPEPDPQAIEIVEPETPAETADLPLPEPVVAPRPMFYPSGLLDLQDAGIEPADILAVRQYGDELIAVTNAGRKYSVDLATGEVVDLATGKAL